MDRSKFIHEVYNSEGVSYGVATDVYLLPVGTKFVVENGMWHGEIIEDNGSKFIAIENDTKLRLEEDYDYGLVITVKEGV